MFGWLQIITRPYGRIFPLILFDSQDAIKLRYDRGTDESVIEAGDLVLIKDENRGDTLSPLYKGPWKVVERKGLNVVVSDPHSNRILILIY